jgi:hypothetical protein
VGSVGGDDSESELLKLSTGPAKNTWCASTRPEIYLQCYVRLYQRNFLWAYACGWNCG